MEDGSNFSSVVKRDVIQNNAFTVVKTDMELPILPLNLMSCDIERDTRRLGDINRLQVLPIPANLVDSGRVVIDNRIQLT